MKSRARNGRPVEIVRPRLGVDVAEAVDDYLMACQAAGHSPKTLDCYGRVLRTELLPWCREQGLATLEELDQRAMDRLGATLLSRPNQRRPQEKLSRLTVRTYLGPVHHLLEWAEREGYAAPGRPQMPKRRKQVRKILSREEIQAMEDAARTERDKLIVRLLGDCGPRVSELVGFMASDLVERNRQWFLVVREGKGGNDRYVPVPRLWPRLLRLATRGRPQESTGHLFLSLRRLDGLYRGLTDDGVEDMIRHLARAAGIQRRVYPHLLRCSAITWMLGKGLNVYQVQMAVGNFNALDHYVHLTAEDAHTAMAGLYE